MAFPWLANLKFVRVKVDFEQALKIWSSTQITYLKQ